VNAAEQKRLDEIVAGYERRLKEQGDSIARMVRHLAYHHQELGHHSTEDCDILSGRVHLNGD
jgi:hypothetical protein